MFSFKLLFFSKPVRVRFLLYLVVHLFISFRIFRYCTALEFAVNFALAAATVVVKTEQNVSVLSATVIQFYVSQQFQ